MYRSTADCMCVTVSCVCMHCHVRPVRAASSRKYVASVGRTSMWHAECSTISSFTSKFRHIQPGGFSRVEECVSGPALACCGLHFLTQTKMCLARTNPSTQDFAFFFSPCFALSLSPSLSPVALSVTSLFLSLSFPLSLFFNPSDADEALLQHVCASGGLVELILTQLQAETDFCLWEPDALMSRMAAVN